MNIHLTASELSSHPISSNQINRLSLDALRNITHPAHGFAITEGIDDVILIKLQYNCGGQLETYQYGNVLVTLIKKNQQRCMRYADIMQGTFVIQRTGYSTPITVTISPDIGEVIIEDNQLNTLPNQADVIAELKKVVWSWVHQAGFVITLPATSLHDEGNEKKTRYLFLLLGSFSQSAALSTQLYLFNAAFQSERCHYSVLV